MPSSFRTFNSPGGPVVNGVAYLYDNNSGVFRPAFTTDFASNVQMNVSGLSLTVGAVAVTGGVIQVTNATPIPVSGVSTILSLPTQNVAVTGGSVNANITNVAPIAISGVVTSVGASNTDVVSALTTGNSLNIVSNAILSGISGILATNLAGAAWVTGAVSVTNTSPIAISGVVSASVTASNADVVAAQVSGNNLLSGISGLLSSNLTDPAWVTGAVSINNALPIPVSGVVFAVISGGVSASVSNPIGVTGTRYDQALPTIGTAPNFVMIGGRAVNSSGAGSITGYNNTGDFAVLNISRENGGVLVNQGALDYTQDSVTSIISGQALTNTTVANQLLSGISGVLTTRASWVTGQVTVSASSAASVSNEFVSGLAQLAIPSTATRKAWFIQNLATGTLLVRLGSSAPTTGALNFALRGGMANNDGQGASFSDSPAVYTGPVYVSGLGEAPMLYTAWQV